MSSANKRRIQGNASGTGSSTKKRSWRDDDDDKKPSKVSKSANSSDDDLLEAAAKADEDGGDAKYVANPVVWLDISVAGKQRGKVFFELFCDAAPEAAEVMRALCSGPLKGTELHKIVQRKYAEGGDIDVPESALEAAEKAVQRAGKHSAMKHTKAGLLTCKPAGPNGFLTLLFQVTLCPSPKLDGEQTVFGQLVAGPGQSGLHPLHWISSAGNADGNPRDTVLVEDCGLCDGAEAEKLTGQPQVMEPPYPPPESQDERYSRAGNTYSTLGNALSSDNVEDVIELTEDLLYYLEYEAKKAKKEGGGGGTRMYRSAEIETELKEMRGVLESAEHKAGEVKGFENKVGRSVKGQLIRIKELGEILNRLF